MSGTGANALVYVDASRIHGRGLFARQAIPAGTLIGHYEGKATQRNGRYVLWMEGPADGEWQGIDGSNDLRFMNHSDRPNCEMDGTDLYAARDIGAGEEITIDYGDEFSAGLQDLSASPS